MNAYVPRHRRTMADVQNDARCNGSMWSCPRHNADVYADSMARHATDSITPAARYHGSNAWGR